MCGYFFDAADYVTDNTIEEPLRQVCVQLFTIVEDFTGVSIK